MALRLEKQIVVESARYLGMAETPDDPHWLEQCVCPEHEEQDVSPEEYENLPG